MPPVIDLDRVKSLIAAGWSTPQIIATTGVCSQTVLRMREECAKPPGTPSKWKQHEARLRELYVKHGLSCSQIADQFPNATRNSIIGALTRLGIVRDGDRVPKASTPRPQRSKAEYAVSASKRTFNPQSRAAPAPFIDIIPDIPPEKRVKLHDLEPHHCRWPLGEVQSPDFGFCGATRAPGLSYCRSHQARSSSGPAPPLLRHMRKKTRNNPNLVETA